MVKNSPSLEESDRGTGRFALGLALGAMAGFLVVRRLTEWARMPYLANWRRTLAKQRGEAEAARLIARTLARYEDLYVRRERLTNRALRFHLERSTLPGLALYQALLEEGGDRDAALAQMESLMTASIDGLRRLMPPLGRLPDPFAAFRLVVDGLVRLRFPAEGWQMEPVEDSKDSIAFDVRRCFYLDTLTTYGAPELTLVYCGGDDTVLADLPPPITWQRTVTLGRGDDRCNFRWYRAAPKATV